MHRDQDARDVAALRAFDAEFETWQRRLREFTAITRRLAAARYPGAGHLVAPVVESRLVDQLRDLREVLAAFEDPAWWHALDAVKSEPEVQERMVERGHTRFRAHLDALPERARGELDTFLGQPEHADPVPESVLDLYVALTECSPRVVERALAGPNAGAPAWWSQLTS